MARKQLKVPSYCLHKATGQAVVRVCGRDRYLGKYGSANSYEQYERALAEWRAAQGSANGNRLSVPIEASQPLSINGLLLLYLRFAQSYYVDESGQCTRELQAIKYSLRPLRVLFGRSLAHDFGPKGLKAVRQYMIDNEKLSRGLINRRINRIRRVFKWGVSEELVPPSVHEGLRAVDGLRYGRTAAREAPPVRPVPQEHVEAILDAVSPQVRTMIQLQQLAAMRPAEVVSMRGCDIDQTSEIWIYRPVQHKTRWRGHERQIFLGPRAQALLEPFLARGAEDYLFSPREAEENRQCNRRRQRQTPMTPSQARRKRKLKPRRPKRESYDVDSYRRAITYGINRTNRQRRQDGQTEIPHWFPLQLRHSRATEIRRTFGLEASQVYLGHKRADVTQVYAERDLAVGVHVARQVG